MSAIYLIFSQVITKFVTFALNQVLLQNLSPQVFGMMAYCDFFVGSILFFSREAQRLSNQRVSRESSAVRRIVNFLYIPVVLAVPISVTLWGLQRNTDQLKTLVSLERAYCIMALLAALVFLELLAEPFFAVNQYNLGFKTRSKVESGAVLAKSAFFLGTFLLFGTQRGLSSALLAYAIGQAAYSFTVCAGYYLHFRRFFLPSGVGESDKRLKSHESYQIDSALLTIWKALFVQMIFKHLLTEGDTLILSSLFSISQQGVYSVISNYGSIIARLVFQPVEESVRIVTAAKLAKGQKKESLEVMQNYLVFYWNLSLLIILGGYTNGAFLLRMLIGRNALWRDSAVFGHFSEYMVYLPFLAFNGILEAFFSSASQEAQMKRFSLFLSISSVAYFALLVLTIRFLHLSVLGLIISNVVNMLLRIGYCGHFYWNFSKDSGRNGMIQAIFAPLGLFTVAFAAQMWLFHGKTSSFRQLLSSVAICGVVFMGMLWNERRRLLVIRRRKQD